MRGQSADAGWDVTDGDVEGSMLGDRLGQMSNSSGKGTRWCDHCNAMLVCLETRGDRQGGREMVTGMV